MATFNRLKLRQPTAVLKRFQNGRLWDSRLDAREAQRHDREEKPRSRDRASGRPPKKLEWQPKATEGTAPRPKFERPRAQKPRGSGRSFGRPETKLDWRPKPPGGSRGD